MYQKWRDLLFLHWPVPAEQLRPLIPSALDLDLFNGTAYVGLVLFTMKGVRPVGLPAVPWLSSFHETNVRTYVRHGTRRPGVWFFSLDAANAIAVRIARSLFHLGYRHARMFVEHNPARRQGEEGSILYAGVRRWPGPVPASYAVHATPTGKLQPARSDTLDHFLIERYLLYTAKGDYIYEGQVHHTPYPTQSAQLHTLDESLLAAAKIERSTTQPLVHFSPGVDVEIFPLRALSTWPTPSTHGSYNR
jgi:uncharacterized protein YqjF (DUF2071 family)